MSFSLERKTFRSGKSHNLKACPRMSTQEEQPNEASETHTAEQSDESSTEMSPDWMEERIEANLEPVNAHISTLPQMMKTLIQHNSARTNPTAGPRARRFQSESLLTDGPWISRTLPLTSIRTAGYSPDSSIFE